jgi:hypothetical protein
MAAKLIDGERIQYYIMPRSRKNVMSLLRYCILCCTSLVFGTHCFPRMMYGTGCTSTEVNMMSRRKKEEGKEGRKGCSSLRVVRCAFQVMVVVVRI